MAFMVWSLLIRISNHPTEGDIRIVILGKLMLEKKIRKMLATECETETEA